MTDGRTPFTILLVEDNPADVFLVRESLKEQTAAGIQLEVANDGAEALRFLEPRHPSAVPALILLDLNLPKCDGIEVLKNIRRNDRLATVPVIILTSSGSPRDRLSAMELGVTRYVQKASSLEEVVTLGMIIGEILAETLAAASSST